MASKKKKVAKEEEVVREVLDKAEEEGVSPETAAKRMDEETKALDKAAERYDRLEAQGKIAPLPEELPYEDDMRTENDIKAEAEAKLIADITATLKVPKTKDSVMTFSMYSTTALNRRYFLLDVDGDAYRRGWMLYKEAKGDDPVGYIDMVMHIMDLEIPRLHRAVSWVPLN